MMMRQVLFVLLASLLACQARMLQGSAGVFPPPEKGWKQRVIQKDGKESLTPLAAKEGALLLPVALPQGAPEYVMALPQTIMDLSHASKMTLSIQLPEGFPKDRTAITFFSKDNDFLWRQLRLPLKALAISDSGLLTLDVPLSGDDAVKAWECHGHDRPWNSLTMRNLLEFGFRFEQDYPALEQPFNGEAKLLGIQLCEAQPEGPAAVYDFAVSTFTPQIGRRLEVTFKLDNIWPETPIRSDAVSILATITPEKGKQEVIRGFYYEDFIYNAAEREKVKCLTPSGKPCYKIRYCPRVAGRHSMSIAITVNGKTTTLPSFDFEAQPAAPSYHGFVHVDKKFNQYFCYDDGTLFRGVGMNVRSPFDNRLFGVAPYSMWQDEGLEAYDILFEKFEKAGINLVEVWMCSWWLALEWINDAPGFHGVGHYNQYRAWMLDHILGLAEQHGIHLILVINNHGKFGMTYDTEWARNPYNKALGGYLDKCEDYFAVPQAKADCKNLLDYLVARWGASPNLFCWKLFTEVDLTGPNISAYQSNPNISAWHAEMGGYLKQIDIYQHPVTTHWMLNYARIDAATAAVKELDFLSTDVYYSLGEGTKGMINLMIGSRDFGKNHHKPLCITEYGGSSYADTMRNLENQVEVGQWCGFFYEHGILPLYWWFGLVDDKDLYGRYVAVSKYGATEDRRGMVGAVRPIKGADGVQCNELRNDKRILLWLWDYAYYYAGTQNAVSALRKNITVDLPVLAAGNYELQFWNIENGDIIAKQPFVMPAKGTVTIKIPDFKRAITAKIIPVN